MRRDSRSSFPQPSADPAGPPEPRVLIANHDAFSRVYFTRAVSRVLKAEIHEALNGVEALELLDSRTFDILLLDLELPVLTGLDLLEFIRDDPAQKRLQVIVTTAVGGEEVVRQAIAVGVSDYLLKPYQQSAVEDRLTRALVRAQASREEEEPPPDDSTKPRLLVGDRDDNFCKTVQAAVSHLAEVKAVASIPEVLTNALRWKPHFLWLHRDLAGHRTDFLLSKLHAISHSHEINTYLVSETPQAPLGPEHPSKGWIEKTFVPQKLVKCFQQSLSSSEVVLEGPRKNFDLLQPEVVTAVRQVFGVMTGAEAKNLPNQCDVKGDLAAALVLQNSVLSTSVKIVLCTDRALAAALYAEMIGQAEEVADEELVDGVLGEMLNMVGGRVKSCYEHHGQMFKMGLPKVHQGSADLLEAHQFVARHYFQWNNFEPFSLTISQGPDQVGPDAAGH